MTTLGYLAAVAAGLIHVLFFVMESILFPRPAVWRRFLVASQEHADAIRLFALNQGYYNLFLATGAIGGAVVALAAEPDTALTGGAIALFSCACMVGAGLVLLLTDVRMLRAALVQAVPPALALILVAVA